MAPEQRELASAPMLADTAIGLRNTFAKRRSALVKTFAAAILLCICTSVGVLLADPGCRYASADEMVHAIDVAGAGSRECNGRYFIQGYIDGKPSFWKAGTRFTIMSYEGWWLLSLSYAGKSWYAVNSTSTTPPPGGWVVGPQGRDPVPKFSVVMATEGERCSVAELRREFGTFAPLAAGWLILFCSCVMGRLCCAERSTAKMRMFANMGLSFAQMALVLALARVAYLATDCNDAPKGTSDLLFLVAIVSSFVALVSFTLAGIVSTYKAQFGGLLHRIAELAQRQEPDVLVLEVSEARLRQHLLAESERDASLTISSSPRRHCLLLAVFMLICIVVSAMVDDQDFHRSSFWNRVFALGLPCLFLMLALAWQVWITPGCQNCLQRRRLRHRLAEVHGPARLLLFHNTSAASPGRLDGMSAAFFEGKMVAAFGLQGAALPGVWRRETRASVLTDDAEPSCAVLSFALKSERTSPALWQGQDARIEGAVRVPLDRGQETVVRDWLEARREVFGYGALEEVEMQ
mmetsp:Transcript_74940/g.173776  ORF Transcript_74940/g.173776 Transcript_74940/m.173776 type:complete len:520 (-) Transcript_74940:4-1563(-)